MTLAGFGVSILHGADGDGRGHMTWSRAQEPTERATCQGRKSMGPPGAVVAVVSLLAPAEAAEAVTVAGALVDAEGLSDLLTGVAVPPVLTAGAPITAG